jgi:hypothetical protein
LLKLKRRPCICIVALLPLIGLPLVGFDRLLGRVSSDPEAKVGRFFGGLDKLLFAEIRPLQHLAPVSQLLLLAELVERPLLRLLDLVSLLAPLQLFLELLRAVVSAAATAAAAGGSGASAVAPTPMATATPRRHGRHLGAIVPRRRLRCPRQRGSPWRRCGCR